MNCQTARERMLEADPAELGTGSEGSLSGHLRECAECRATANRFLEGMSLLDRELAVASARPVDAALERLRHRRRVSPSWIMPTATAAAAILASVFFFGPWHDRAPLSDFDPVVGSLSPAPVIEDVGGMDMAMFATTNPRITVVWIYEEDPQ